MFSLQKFGMVLFLLSVVLTSFVAIQPVHAATKTAVQNGNWDASATWGGAPPVSADDVVIPAGIIVTIPVALIVNRDAGTTFTSAGSLNNNGTLTNNGTITNNYRITNDGQFINYNSLTNNDWIGNTSTGTFDNYLGTFLNNDVFNNTGLAYNHATFNNYGRILNNDVFTNYNTSVLNNYATLDNYDTFNNNFGATVENYATINNNGVFNNNGTVNKYCGAVITGNLINGNAVITIPCTTTTPTNPPTVLPTNTSTILPTNTPNVTFTPSASVCAISVTAPTLISPAHRAHLTDTTPTFSWSPVINAQSYRLMVYLEDRSFEFKKRLFTTAYTIEPQAPLVVSQYLWRVRTQDTTCSTWSTWSKRNTLFID